MPKKSLIMYASWTGNTEKVALRFKEAFEKKGWECDMFKAERKVNVTNPPYDFNKYDFLCVGSPVVNKWCVGEISTLLNGGLVLPSSAGGPEGAKADESYKRELEEMRRRGGVEKIDFGPNDKKGVVFVTYGGEHLTPPKEAEPSLSFMECLMELAKFRCVGKFCCPGKHGEIRSAWVKDLHKRPFERDLQQAEAFMEEIIEEFG